MNLPDSRLLCGALAALLALHAAPAIAQDPVLQGQDLIYSYDEMFDFDTATWLQANAPHLQDRAEAISHWAGHSGISPKVLLALMDLQSGVLDPANATSTALQRPFGALADTHGFNDQLREVAHSLQDAMYDADDPATRGAVPLSRGNPLDALLAAAPPSVARGDDASINVRFQQAYRRLFGAPRTASATPRYAGPQQAGTVPPRDLLEFPYPRNVKWNVGGAHTGHGSGRFPMSSLDMHQGGWWGSNQSGKWVSASAAGTFKRHSSCLAEIVHGAGWSTSYYHLANIRAATGAQLQTNAAFANPANTLSQAICNGGFSSGPHQHWSLKYNGGHHHLNGVTLSGYLIKATGTSYDTNCSVFNLSKDGKTYCSGNYTNFGPGKP